MILQEDTFTTKRKALRINLEPAIYGTVAEIGGGQEVARSFFQAGGASGTIAKSISAYDKTFSDNLYNNNILICYFVYCKKIINRVPLNYYFF